MRQAVEANVRWTVKSILETPEAQERRGEGVLQLVGAVYDLTTVTCASCAARGVAP